jgi:hypothetical protein
VGEQLSYCSWVQLYTLGMYWSLTVTSVVLLSDTSTTPQAIIHAWPCFELAVCTNMRGAAARSTSTARGSCAQLCQPAITGAGGCKSHN